MEATVSGSQEMTETTLKLMQPKLEKNIKNQVNDVLSPVDQWTWGICKELGAKTEEMQA
jgi:hypothetical protein